MKILQLIDPSISHEQLAEALTVGRALMSQGHDVRLYHRLDEDAVAPFSDAGIKTMRCRLGGALDIISPVMVSRVIDRDDRVVLQTFTPAVLTCASRVRRLAPEEANVRIAYHTGRTVPQFTTPAKERLAAEPDRYIVPFRETAERIAAAYPAISSDRIAVAAPALDRLSPLPSPAPREESAPLTALFYGHILPSKGLDRLLSALEDFSPSELRVIVLGTGEGRHVMPLLRRVRANGVNSLIDWAGDARKPYEVVARADVAVFPSVSECDDYLPMMAVMRQGLPVIASPLSSAPQLFNSPEQYITIDPEKPEEIADALRCLISDPSLRRRLSEASASRYADLEKGTDTGASLASLYFSLFTL